MEMDRLKKANTLAGKISDLEGQLEYLNSPKGVATGSIIHMLMLNEHGLLKLDTLKQELKESLTAKLAALKEEFEAL